ncbi:MAG TPA: response regulator [Tepidisphaeraceae bacterium]|jgi:signal transduction histidine kinase
MNSSSSHIPRIFVLDDDAGIFRLECRALERAGYQASGAVSYDEAKVLIQNQMPDLLVLDYNLGGPQSGLDFFRHTRQTIGNIPAVLVTGFSDEGRAIEALRAGISDVIPKAHDYLDYLPEAVGRVLQQVKASRELANAQAASLAKDRFLAILSHELRTPLTPALSAVQSLQAMSDLPADAHDALAMVRRNIEMEVCLIDDLLDLTRVARGKLRLQFSLTDIHEKLRNAIVTVDDEARAKGLTIATDFRSAHPNVEGDPTRLQQIFWNLLKNAVKFTPAGGSILVRTQDLAKENKIAIEIEDTGIGIEADFLPHIFDAFNQGSADTPRKFGGLGLGLNICKALVEAHGGKISVSSPGVNRGARFIVELPLRSMSDSAANQRIAALPALSAPQLDKQGHSAEARILLVDDHHDTAYVLAKLLRRAGHHVTATDSVGSALKAAGTENFDVVISDIGLPDGSGLDLMRQLRSRFNIQGIAMSGFGTEQDQMRSRDAGFREHLVKPINLDSLLDAVRRSAENKAAC